MIVRIDFDIKRPFVAGAELTCKGRTFQQRDPFPWQELGFSEGDMTEMWMAGLVDHVDAKPVAAPIVAPPQLPAKPQKQRHSRR